MISLVTNLAAARTAVGSVLVADGEPLVVKAARPHKHRWLVQFEGCDSREAADRLAGRRLEAPPLDTEAVVGAGADQIVLGGFATEVVGFAHELIGLRLIDQHDVDHGEVVALVENPAADLVELADGRLVPLSFHRGHDDEVLRVEVPPGLLDGDPVET